MKRLKEIFNIRSGNDLELCYLEKDENGINFISRTSKNHGISSKVRVINGKQLNPAGTLTVAVGGSVLETFLQDKEYYTGYHIKVLEPINSMTDNEKLFYCLCIRANKYRYNFGRQANATLGELEVPKLPKWINDIKLNNIEFYRKPKLDKNIRLEIDFKRWKKFKVDDIFDLIEQCKCGNSSNLINGEEIWYIGAKKDENGLMRKVVNDKSLVSRGKGVILIGDGQGSVGYANYIDMDFIGSTTLNIGYGKEIDKYVGLFLVTMFNYERYRYNYGRKWSGIRLRESEIRLPIIVDEHSNPILNEESEYKIDYEFIREYIKTIPFSSKL